MDMLLITKNNKKVLLYRDITNLKFDNDKNYSISFNCDSSLQIWDLCEVEKFRVINGEIKTTIVL